MKDTNSNYNLLLHNILGEHCCYDIINDLDMIKAFPSALIKTSEPIETVGKYLEKAFKARNIPDEFRLPFIMTHSLDGDEFHKFDNIPVFYKEDFTVGANPNVIILKSCMPKKDKRSVYMWAIILIVFGIIGLSYWFNELYYSYQLSHYGVSENGRIESILVSKKSGPNSGTPRYLVSFGSNHEWIYSHDTLSMHSEVPIKYLPSYPAFSLITTRNYSTYDILLLNLGILIYGCPILTIGFLGLGIAMIRDMRYVKISDSNSMVHTWCIVSGQNIWALLFDKSSSSSNSV